MPYTGRTKLGVKGRESLTNCRTNGARDEPGLAPGRTTIGSTQVSLGWVYLFQTSIGFCTMKSLTDVMRKAALAMAVIYRRKTKRDFSLPLEKKWGFLSRLSPFHGPK